MSKRLYERWYPIRSIAEFDACPHEWYIVYFGNKEKTMHFSWLISWQYRTLQNKISKREVWIAKRIGESK